MKRLDLIIDALVYAKGESLSYEVWDRVDKALAAARELRELKPVAWFELSDGMYFEVAEEYQGHENTTPLYALGDEK